MGVQHCTHDRVGDRHAPPVALPAALLLWALSRLAAGGGRRHDHLALGIGKGVAVTRLRPSFLLR
jgi:hypothetical protein